MLIFCTLCWWRLSLTLFGAQWVCAWLCIYSFARTLTSLTPQLVFIASTILGMHFHFPFVYSRGKRNMYVDVYLCKILLSCGVFICSTQSAHSCDIMEMLVEYEMPHRFTNTRLRYTKNNNSNNINNNNSSLWIELRYMMMRYFKETVFHTKKKLAEIYGYSKGLAREKNRNTKLMFSVSNGKKKLWTQWKWRKFSVQFYA